MSKSLHELLATAVNYAGLYPPTSLMLNEALSSYVDFSHSKYSWMLANFVLPHNELPSLSNFADKKHYLKGPLSLCITGPETQTLFEFKNVINSIEKEIKDAHTGYPGEVRTNLLELKLPLNSVETLNPEELIKALEAVVSTTAESRLLPHRVFFEVPGHEYNAEITKKIIKVIAVHNKSLLKRKVNNYLFSGIKINCSDKKTGKIPDAAYIADVLLYARDANVAVKFSGKENTPFPSYNYSLGMKVHGFINIFAASILAYTQDLTLEETVEVIEEKNPENFTFKDDYFAWRELAAPTLEIKMLRMLSITSFNFTSFTTPIDGLKSLDYL